MTDRKDGSYVMDAQTPSGRAIRVIWRYDIHQDEVPDVVENGIVRPLDPNIQLTEQSRVIIVTSETV